MTPPVPENPLPRNPIPRNPGRGRRGFTLIETMIVIIIIAILVSLAFVVLAGVIKNSRGAAQRAALVSLRMGVDSFKKDFDFYPPLVYDNAPGGPVNLGNNTPRVRDNDFLRSQVMPDEARFSVYSLPYYLLGALGADVDGVPGAGLTQPQLDGSFSRRGRKYDAFFDTSRNPEQLQRDPADEHRVQLLDRWKNPIRFYRWLPSRFPMSGGAIQGTVNQYYVPRAVGDPNLSPELRDASYAIVCIGPDGDTDNRKPLPTAGRTDPATDGAPIDTHLTGDDIVEVGR